MINHSDTRQQLNNNIFIVNVELIKKRCTFAACLLCSKQKRLFNN